MRQARPLSAPQSNAADVLGGEWCGDYLVVERTYSPGYRHGRIALADAAPPVEGWNRLGLLGGGASPCLFLDLETLTQIYQRFIEDWFGQGLS